MEDVRDWEADLLVLGNRIRRLLFRERVGQLTLRVTGEPGILLFLSR